MTASRRRDGASTDRSRGGDRSLVLAIDGGNSKTDVALVRTDGTLAAFVRGPLSSPQQLGIDGCLATLSQLFDEACAKAELDGGDLPVAEVAEILLAGLDLAEDEAALLQLIEGRRWAARPIVGNDTFALLRAGTERGWGVAVVCGAGINCVGVAPDGRHARFAALGATSGDWGGGIDIGLAALSAAARSEDGRGPTTVLERVVPAHFGMESPLDLAEALHLKTIPMHRLAELAPVVLHEAADDPVAADIVDRLAAEIVGFARTAIERLELAGQDVEVILGGGVMQSGNVRLLAAIEKGLSDLGPAVSVRVTAVPPIVGAALLALDEAGADAEAKSRLRRELGEAVHDHQANHSPRPRSLTLGSTARSEGDRDG